jgi:hypothetical protein
MLIYILELPWKLGVPDDHTIEIDVRPGEEEADAKKCRLRFRTVPVRVQIPLAASDLAFGSLQQDGELGDEEKEDRARRRKELTESPYKLDRTVVAVYVPSEQDPPSPDAESLGRGLYLALDALNTCLIAVGLLYDDRLRPIAIGDLPAIIPVMPAAVIDGRLQHGPGILMNLRDPAEEIRTYDEDELDQVGRMAAVIVSDDGFANFYELIQRAGAARRADRHREAVVDYGTAGELFITTLLLEVGVRREIDTEKLENIVNGPFRDRALHLCRLLNVPDDPENPDCPLFYWWLHCYTQRNGIVHRGAGSIGMWSEAARLGMIQMVVDIREAIRADEQIAEVAGFIRWGTRVDNTGGGQTSGPDPLPSR